MKKFFSGSSVNRLIFGLFFIVGFSLFSSNLDAQTELIPTLENQIQIHKNLQQTFTPGTAKWDMVELVVDHLQKTLVGLQNDPNYINSREGYDLNRIDNPIFLNAHPTVLANYTTEQLESFKATSFEGGSSRTEKIAYILKANSY